MRCHIAAMALVAIVALVAHSAPCPHIEKRQFDMLSELADNSVPEVDIAGNTQLSPVAADTANTAEALTPNTVNNLAGNTLIQIDDSTNNSVTNIDYPDETQMTGNTGTAVSGNNNDIMPIINAPVTVIINNTENDHHSHPAGGKTPVGAPHPPPLAPQQLPQARTASTQPSSVSPGGPPVQQPMVPPYPGQAGVDPFNDRIQQLILYALAVSQGRISSIAS